MSQFRQKPVSQKRKIKASKPWRLPEKVHRRRKPRSAARMGFRHFFGSFKVPVQSLATIALIACTVVIALAALNWEDFNLRTPDIYSFRLSESSIAGQQMIQYAATGISSRLPPINIQGENTGSAGAETVNAEAENPHGRLVTFEWQQHRVQRGETVSAIAQRFGISVGAIIASNNISNARRLQEGTVLRIPNIDGIPYQVRRGDSLSRIAASFNVPLEVILDINDIKSDNLRVGETLFIPGARMSDIDLRRSLGELFAFPLQGRHITSPFGMRRDPISGALQFHDGVDFRGRIGTPVMASLDGVVSVVGENWLYGKYIILTHANGYRTLYAHLNSFNVREGDRVARGRKIGEVGNTGYSTGPHLHFGVYDRNNRLVNPMDLLN